MRRDRVGFVFQTFNLIPTLTALENITLPSSLAGDKPDQAWLDRIVDTVGLGDRLSAPAVGALRRSAAARRGRAGARDQARDHLRRRTDRQPRLPRQRRDPRLHDAAVQEFGQTIVMVTHDPISASYSNRVVFLADGHIVDELLSPTADAVLGKMRNLGRRVADVEGHA